MSRRNRCWYLVVVVAVTVLSAACSSAGTVTGSSATTGNDPTGTAGTTQASFIASANAICAAARAASSTFKPQASPGDTTLAPVASMFEQWAAGLQRTLAQVQALPQPAGHDSALAELYAEMSDLQAAGARLAVAARKDDLDQTAVLWADLDGRESKFDSSATAYGLSDCATHTPGPS